jgi:hypothetical protein
MNSYTVDTPAAPTNSYTVDTPAAPTISRRQMKLLQKPPTQQMDRALNFIVRGRDPYFGCTNEADRGARSWDLSALRARGMIDETNQLTQQARLILGISDEQPSAAPVPPVETPTEPSPVLLDPTTTALGVEMPDPVTPAMVCYEGRAASGVPNGAPFSLIQHDMV